MLEVHAVWADGAVQRTRTVATGNENRRRTARRGFDRAVLWEAGQSSSLPTRRAMLDHVPSAREQGHSQASLSWG
jgi:hypothetical protein